MSPDAIEWQERLDALQALISAPFVVLLIVTITVAVIFTARVERRR